MAVTIYPVTPSFAAEVGDIDLSRQIEPVDLAAVNKAFAEYAVLIFPDQHLSQDQHLDFAKHFGPHLDLHRKPMGQAALSTSASRLSIHTLVPT